MSLLNKSKESLESRQEAMKIRIERDKQKKEEKLKSRPICISCNRRIAREGSPYCSRCTASGMVNNLRDTLPGLPTKEVDVELLRRSVNTISPQPDEYCVTENNGECVSTDPRCMHNQPEPATTKKVYTRSEVAKLLGVSASTLVRWEKKGVIPPPSRITHNNQCVYTEEMIEIGKKYKEASYLPPISTVPGSPGVLPRTVKSARIDRKLEKAVARRLGSVGRLLR